VDSGWYGGHYLPGYSLLAPALGALVGERLLLALCAVAAAGLFGLLTQRTFQSAGAASPAARSRSACASGCSPAALPTGSGSPSVCSRCSC